MKKVVLAFSGGLDTSVCIKLLEENYEMEVITVCVDVGQPEEEIERPAAAADKIGSSKHYTIDAKEEFAEDFIFRASKSSLKGSCHNPSYISSEYTSDTYAANLSSLLVNVSCSRAL